jgi:hypothetical protein
VSQGAKLMAEARRQAGRYRVRFVRDVRGIDVEGRAWQVRSGDETTLIWRPQAGVRDAGAWWSSYDIAGVLTFAADAVEVLEGPLK